jgi:hypothetical protein
MSDIDIETEDGGTYRVVGLSPRGRSWLVAQGVGTVISTAGANNLWRRMREAGLVVLVDGKPRDAGEALQERPTDFDEQAASVYNAVEDAMLRGRRRGGDEWTAANQPPMSDAEIAALDTLIDYLVYDEMRDFEDNPRSGHIYLAILVLARWRKRDVSDWPTLP